MALNFWLVNIIVRPSTSNTYFVDLCGFYIRNSSYTRARSPSKCRSTRRPIRYAICIRNPVRCSLTSVWSGSVHAGHELWSQLALNGLNQPHSRLSVVGQEREAREAKKSEVLCGICESLTGPIDRKLSCGACSRKRDSWIFQQVECERDQVDWFLLHRNFVFNTNVESATTTVKLSRPALY